MAESELGAALGRRCPARGRRFRRRGCKAEPDGLEQRAREDAMVRAALARGPFALVVLGGEHDLTESARRVAGADCEYVPVTVGGYPE